MTMKRILYAIAMLGVLFVTSCKKDEIGNTATVDMAGEWQVMVDVYDPSGTLLAEDWLGSFLIGTFNTAENVSNKMFVSDNGNLESLGLAFQVELVADPATKTFKTDGAQTNLYSGTDVTVKNGKIVYGGSVTPSGMPADSIEFDIEYSDDPYGGLVYHIYGFRYTGLASDD